MNLNTKNTHGVYHQLSNGNASTSLNYPSASAGILEVFVAGSYVLQRYTVILTSTVYVRWKSYDGSWMSWARV